MIRTCSNNFGTCYLNTSKKNKKKFLMSLISVRNLSIKTTKEDLQRTFRVFGKISYIDYKKSKDPNENNGKATILFRSKNSALQACEYDQTFLNGHLIDVSIKLKSKKVKVKDFRPFVFTLKEYMIILLIFCISFLTHYTKVYWPNDVVFTESTTGKCVNDYFSQKRCFDVEPPLHTLTYYLYAKYMCGYNGTFPFDKKMQYPKKFDHVKLRHLPCLLSTLVAPILTTSLLFKHCTIWSSFLVGLLFSFDFTSIILGKLFINEPLAYFLVSCTILFSSMLTRFNNLSIFCFQIIFAALTYTTKLNTFCCIFFVIITNFYALKNKKNGISQFIVRFVIGFILFWSIVFLVYASHLYLTPEYGNAEKYLPNDFRKKSMLSQVFILMKTISKYNSLSYKDNAYNTKWYKWPLFLATPFLIWAKNANTQIIAVFNNPVTAFVSMFGGLNSFLIRKSEWFYGYFIAFAPFIFSIKSALSLNYEIPLIFGICGFAFSLDRMDKYLRGLLIILLIIALFCAYFVWIDWLYAIPMSYNTFNKTMIWPKLRKILNWKTR